ncbi:MAG: hypothetical protein BWY72_01099 [Bacteroidetes bacterium ADurb.Bin416]|nr:MAG: hypothetical protein BWY72_01099 [Bacteroidetes bacterium ADurb.Bin416]
MQFLELPEGDNHIGLFGQLLSALAQGCLDFQVFLEIVFPEFVVDFEQVVKPLHVYLIIFPEFVDLILRNRACLFPGLLKPPEFRQCPAYVFRAFGQQADIFNDCLLLLQVLCALLFLFGVMFGSFLPPTVQQGLEFFFQGVIFSRFGALCFGCDSLWFFAFFTSIVGMLYLVKTVKGLFKVVDAVFLVVAWLLN